MDVKSDVSFILQRKSANMIHVLVKLRCETAWMRFAFFYSV